MDFCPLDVTKDDYVENASIKNFFSKQVQCIKKLHLAINTTSFSLDLFLWLVLSHVSFSNTIWLKVFFDWVDCSVILLCTYINYIKSEWNDYLKLFILIDEAKCKLKGFGIYIWDKINIWMPEILKDIINFIFEMSWCWSCWSVQFDRSSRVSSVFIVHSTFIFIIMHL